MMFHPGPVALISDALARSTTGASPLTRGDLEVLHQGRKALLVTSLPRREQAAQGPPFSAHQRRAGRLGSPCCRCDEGSSRVPVGARPRLSELRIPIARSPVDSSVGVGCMPSARGHKLGQVPPGGCGTGNQEDGVDDVPMTTGGLSPLSPLMGPRQ